MHSPLIDCFQQSKTTIDIMTFIQPINSNARLNFSHFYKEIISVVWLALRHAVKFLPGRKSIFPYAACFWITLIQQITNNIWWDGLSRRFLKESNVRIVYFQFVVLHFIVDCGGLSCMITLYYTNSTSTGILLTQKALSFGCIPLELDIYCMRRAVHAELSPCDCPPNIRCLMYGSILWSAIRD